MYAVINPSENYSIAVLLKYISCIEVTDEYVTCLFEFNKENRENKQCFVLNATNIESNPELKFSIYEYCIKPYFMYSYDVKALFELTRREKYWANDIPIYTFIKFDRKDIENDNNIVVGKNIHCIPDDPHTKDSYYEIHICRNRKLAFEKMHKLTHLDVNRCIDSTTDYFNELKKEVEVFINAKNKYDYQHASHMEKLIKLFKKVKTMNKIFKNDDKWLLYRSHLNVELDIIKKQISEHIEKIFNTNTTELF